MSKQPIPLHSERNLIGLADDALDGQIDDHARKIDRALVERQEALDAVADCEQRAVLAAWQLGKCLVEKKRRLPHGHFTDWCLAFAAQTGVSGRSARDYMRLASHFGSAANLRPSIRKSLMSIPSEPSGLKREPTTQVLAIHTANPPKQSERTDINFAPSGDEGAPADTVRYIRAAHAPLPDAHYKAADEELRRALSAPRQANGRAAGFDDSLGTPVEVLDRVRVVFGCAIGCDPASNAEAQALVQAQTWYDGSEGRDGLIHPWCGPLYLYPPDSAPMYSHFVSKLEREVTAGGVAEWLVLTNLVAETQAGQALLRMANCMCFPAGRMSFLAGTEPVRNNAIGQMLIYGGPHAERFCEVFSEIGQCAIPVVGALNRSDGHP